MAGMATQVVVFRVNVDILKHIWGSPLFRAVDSIYYVYILYLLCLSFVKFYVGMIFFCVIVSGDYE